MMLSVNPSHPQSKIKGQPERFFMTLGQDVKYYDNKTMLTMFIEWPGAKWGGGSLKDHYHCRASLQPCRAWVDSLGLCSRAELPSPDVSPAWSDLCVPPADLAAQQRLHRRVGPRDVCQGREVSQLSSSSQSIIKCCQSPETPLHRLLPHWHPTARVSEDRCFTFCPQSLQPPPTVFVFPILILSSHLSTTPSQPPPVSTLGLNGSVLANRFKSW